MSNKTNTEFVADLMNFSAHGALAQVFILTAIQKYADVCSERRIDENCMVNPDAWQGVAREIRDKMAAAGY